MSQYSHNYDISGGAVLIGGQALSEADRRALIASLEGQIPTANDRKVRNRLLNRLHNNYIIQEGFNDDPQVRQAKGVLRDERRGYRARARVANPNYFYGRSAGPKRSALVGNLARLPQGKREPSEYNKFSKDMNAIPRVKAMPFGLRNKYIAREWKRLKEGGDQENYGRYD